MKKFFCYQGYFKKVFGLILVPIILFLKNVNVYASILTVDNVSKQFDQSSLIQEINQFGRIVTSKVNTIDKTLDIYSDGEKFFSFTYGDDYIEYNNRSADVTEENCSEDTFTVYWLYGVMQSVFNLSGYNDKIVDFNESYVDTYDSYGIQFETEQYNFSGNYEDGSSYKISGLFFKYFKISLDTEKIDSLITKYGQDVKEQDANKEFIKLVIDSRIASWRPTLEVKDIKEDSATLYPSIINYNGDEQYDVNCYIYRSDSENGTYEKISDRAINCFGSVGVVDEGLKSNTTYYYKTIIDGGTVYSKPLKVTTNSISTTTTTNNNDNNNQDSIIKNPETGDTFYIITITLVLLGSIVLMIFAKKKSLFKQI